MYSGRYVWLGLFALLAIFIATGCATTMGTGEQGIKVTLTGDQEAPAVKTSASGSGTIVVVSSDKSVSGSDCGAHPRSRSRSERSSNHTANQKLRK